MFKIIKRRKAYFNGYYKQSYSNKKIYYHQLIFLGLFTVGLCIGAFSVRGGTSDILAKFLSIYENYISIKAGETLVVNFSNSFFKSLVLLIFTYSVGLCAVGTPLLYTVPIINGIGTGTLSAYMYSKFALKGIGYCALMVYPGKTIITTVMIAACTYSVMLSTKMLKMLTTHEEEINFKEYNIKYLILILTSVLSALIDTVLNSLFSSYFNFH